jgi:hypothetical protein
MLSFLENQTEMMPEKMAVSSRKFIEGFKGGGVEGFRGLRVEGGVGRLKKILKPLQQPQAT